ncbi:hypothetical protein [Streptomyces sp. NPDC001422]|uniref:hypothetical protein n=1 Tax=Streptomyces sp. NPDC001422 TaxID=3364575 RepID=UPI0036C78637
MALPRNAFGGTSDSVAEDITGARVPGATGTAWSGPSAGATQITDLLDSSLGPISQLVADQNGFVGPFYGPPGVETLWVDFGSGRVALVSSDIGARLDDHLYGGAPDPHGDRAYSDAQLAVHNAPGGVHGVGAGSAVVGTTDVQTLTNKTLTSPTVTGSFQGSPNFTGTPSFNGSAGIPFVRGAATTSALRFSVTGDTNDRFGVSAAGTLSWGSGSAAQELTLTRDQTNVLALTGQFRVYRPNLTDTAFYTRLAAGDTLARLSITAGGVVNWGDGASTPDSTLYRTGNNALKTDGSFAVGGDLAVTATTWTNFTPAWIGLGSGTLSTNVGWYKKLGKIVFFEIYATIGTAGTGSSGVAVAFPSTPYRDGAGANTTRQFVSGYIAGSSGGVIDGLTIMAAFAGDSGTTGATLRRWDGIPNNGSNFGSGTVITIQGWYREA